MKNMKVFVVYFILLILLAGCVGQEKENPEKAPETKQRDVQQPVEPEPVPEAEPAPAPTPSPVLIGSAQTKILDWADNRIHNIRLAIGKINGYMLEPGQGFSFNQVVGPRTAERGYKTATVLMHQEKVQDYGGGVCQVSSTLFQAVRAAGLTVTERHSHQKDVGYAHPGDDAAVDYGNKDMSFVNNTGKTIKIEMSVGNGVVSAAVYQTP